MRSTAWCYALVVAISLGLTAITSLAINLNGGTAPAADQAHLLVQAGTFGVFFAQLVVVVLGVLAMTGEYSSGMIRSTLAAVPGRLPVLAAKAIVLFVATFVVGALSTVGSFLIAAQVLAAQGVHASLFDANVCVPLLGGALYLALVSVFALGIGAIVRSSAGGISASLGFVLLVPIVLQMLPGTWESGIEPYLISNAGINMFGVPAFTAVSMAPGQELLIVLGWLAASLVTAAVLLRRRDA